MRFQLTTAVWGPWYVDRFLKANLPSLMSPGNVPALLERGRGRYTVYTRPRDAKIIRDSGIFKRVSRLIRFEIKVYQDEHFAGNPHVIHARLWEIALREAREAREWIALISPDTLWADGSLDSIGRQFESGKAICYGFPLRVVDETAIPELTKKYGYGHREAIDIAPRKLVDVGLRHLSPMTGAYLRDARHFAFHPEYLLEPVPGEGLVYRAITAHCFAVDPGQVTLGPTLSPTKTCDIPQVAFMTDSDEFAFLSFTSATHQIHWYFCQSSSDLLETSRTWGVHYTNATHLWKQNFLFHTGKHDVSAWRRATQRASVRLLQQFNNFLAVSVAGIAEKSDLRIAARLLATAVTTARLHRYLHFRKPVTLFLPSDLAFDTRTISSLLANPPQLIKFLLAHVAPVPWNSEDGAPIDIAAAGGDPLALRGGARPTVNGHRVVRKIEAPVLGDLAVPIYEIDGLLHREGAQWAF